MQPTIYADHAATTAVSPSVIQAMLPFLTEHYGNPSSMYHLSEAPKAAIARARAQVQQAIGAKHAREIYFTSCGTETTGPSKASQHI